MTAAFYVRSSPEMPMPTGRNWNRSVVRRRSEAAQLVSAAPEWLIDERVRCLFAGVN